MNVLKINKLEERFIFITRNISITLNGEKVIPKQCAKECEDICLKFQEWLTNESWKLEYFDQTSYTNKQLFSIFINNYLK